MLTRRPHRTTQRQAALSSACRIALRVLENGGQISEALQFLANAGTRYLEGPIAIMVETECKGSWHVAAPAVPPNEPNQKLDQAVLRPPNGAGTAEYLSMPIYSAVGEVLGEIRLYGCRVESAPAEDIPLLRSLADAVTRILD
jgi:hypothetical protein